MQPPVIIFLVDVCNSKHSVANENNRMTPIFDPESQNQFLNGLLLQDFQLISAC